MARMSDSSHTPVVAVILAAGFGMRFDPEHPKQLAQIGGRPVIAWSLEAFEDNPDVTDIVVVVNPKVYEAVDRVADDMGSTKLRALVPGGKERTDSTRAALRFLADNGIPADAKILIHDGVRPFVSPKIINECIAALDQADAATVAIPSTDTILLATPREEGGAPVVRVVPDRPATFRAQTPQCFRFDAIRRAYEKAAEDEDFHPTDDTRVIVDYLPESPVVIVDGSTDNIKITTPDDIAAAEAIAPRAARARRAARRDLAGGVVRDLTAGMGD